MFSTTSDGVGRWADNPRWGDANQYNVSNLDLLGSNRSVSEAGKNGNEGHFPGAWHPDDIDRLQNENVSVEGERVYLQEPIRSITGFEQIIGNSPALKHVLEFIETVAPSDSTVLLLGETGTGKELIARALHGRSRRKSKSFVKLN